MSSTISVGYHPIRNTIVLTISGRLTNEESRTLWHPRIYDTRWNNPRMMEPISNHLVFMESTQYNPEAVELAADLLGSGRPRTPNPQGHENHVG